MRIIKRVVVGWLVFLLGGFMTALLVRRLVPEHGGEEDDFVSIVAAADGREFASRAKDLRHIEVLAVMGGVMLDLRQAHITDVATLDLKLYAGGADVVVPEGWRVEMSSNVVMGGIVNRSDPDVPEDAPLLMVDASIVMGGSEIHQVEVD